MASKPPPTVSPPPPTVAPPPPQEMIPWWAALVTAILTAIVSVLGTIYFLKGTRPSVPNAPPGVGMLFTDAITFLPHILILFGILADIFTLRGAYSIPSLVGLLSIAIHYAMQFLWSGVTAMLGDLYTLIMTPSKDVPDVPDVTALFSGTNTGANVGNIRTRTFNEDARSLLGGMRGGAMSAWNGCEVYGFESLKSPYAPQGLVVTASIFWYYLLDLLMNRNPLDSIATGLAFPLLFGLQVWQLNTCENMVGSVAIKSVIALSEGLIIGGTGYGIVQSSIPERLPSYGLPKTPLLSSMTKNADGTYTAADGTVYVIGPNGEPVPQAWLNKTVKDATTGSSSDGLGPASSSTCPT
jgi:hypothetical protein